MHMSVFIVEDHPLMREMLCELIEETGDFRVSGMAPSGEEALDLMIRSAPDLLLIDLSLPRMSGFELAMEVQRRWPKIRSVMLSGHTEAGVVRRALEAGASGFVVKGNPEEIVEAMRQVARGNTYLSESVRGQVGERS